uniref:VWFA domain-containing protein n=1 Tax=Lepisosteus oculatus TaxID=7918 RepID=W5MD09_LEPOC
MYAQSLPSVSMFCDEASHNRYAPNKQNKKCQYRSTWEVIMESKDFNNVNPPVELSSTRPAFSLLQIHKNRFICLVLDVSGSMSGERLERLKQAATSFILDMVPLGSYVGIVTFSSSPLIKRHLTRVDEHSRQEIINDLPEHAQGGTNICSGLEEGYEVLRRDDGSVDGDEILLLTDGEDSSLSRCLEKARLSGAKIHSLALGQSADESLKKFPNVTGGRMFYASDEFRSNGLIESFLGITDESIELIAEGETLEPDDSFDGSFYIESDIAKDTTIFVTWNTDFIPKVGIYAPYSSTEYHMRDFKVDDNLQYARLHIPEPEVGQWEYLVTNTHTRRQSVTFTVTSKPSDPKAHPAIVNTYIKEMSNINHTW